MSKNIKFFNNYDVVELVKENNNIKYFKTKRNLDDIYDEYALIKSIFVDNEDDLNDYLEELEKGQKLKSSSYVISLDDYEINKSKNGITINIKYEDLKTLDEYFTNCNVTKKDIYKLVKDNLSFKTKLELKLYSILTSISFKIITFILIIGLGILYYIKFNDNNDIFKVISLPLIISGILMIIIRLLLLIIGSKLIFNNILLFICSFVLIGTGIFVNYKYKNN